MNTNSDKCTAPRQGRNSIFPIEEKLASDSTAIAALLGETFGVLSFADAMFKNPDAYKAHTLHFLRAVVIYAKASHGGGLGGLKGLAESIDVVLYTRSDRRTLEAGDPSPHRSTVTLHLCDGYHNHDISREELDDVIAYLDNALPTEARSSWQMTAMIGHYLQTQLSRPARQHRKDEHHS